MTACAIEPSVAHEGRTAPAGCTLSADGSYAARLASAGASWFPERWTLDGAEPYAVPLPRNQPEEPGTEVQPMGDGRVLIHRLVAGRHAFALLYPTGPGTGELPLGVIECPAGNARLRLLPPAPGGEKAYALAVGPRSTTVWLVAGGGFGPERLAEVPGRCSGGVWLDRSERLLALDRESGGRTKAVVVDLERGGEVSPLLQIAADSDDRLLLADHDSGLLIVRSDAPSPGQGRLGWGVLGSTLPVRFPQCLRLRGCRVTPFAIQPGQVLTPESCAVALRVDGPMGSWVGVWRPAERRVHHLPAPEGWLTGTGLWTPEGVLRLPYATPAVPCGVVQLIPPPAVDRPEPGSTGGGGEAPPGFGPGSGDAAGGGAASPESGAGSGYGAAAGLAVGALAGARAVPGIRLTAQATTRARTGLTAQAAARTRARLAAEALTGGTPEASAGVEAEAPAGPAAGALFGPGAVPGTRLTAQATTRARTGLTAQAAARTRARLAAEALAGVESLAGAGAGAGALARAAAGVDAGGGAGRRDGSVSAAGAGGVAEAVSVPGSPPLPGTEPSEPSGPTARALPEPGFSTPLDPTPQTQPPHPGFSTPLNPTPQTQPPHPGFSTPLNPTPQTQPPHPGFSTPLDPALQAQPPQPDGSEASGVSRPVPLQQAPLGRFVTK